MQGRPRTASSSSPRNPLFSAVTAEETRTSVHGKGGLFETSLDNKNTKNTTPTVADAHQNKRQSHMSPQTQQQQEQQQERVKANEDSFDGLLRRHVGGFKKWKALHYVKEGFYLEEYGGPRPASARSGAGGAGGGERGAAAAASPAAPVAVYDLTHVDLINTERSGHEEFSVRFANGEEARFLAPSVADKGKWVNAVRAAQPDDVGNAPNFPAALIAPIRRRHMSVSMPRRGKDALASGGHRRDEPFKMIASLRVHVMEGTDVGSDASSSFKPSPYAVVVVDGLNRATTHAKHNTSNPFWAQEFFFDTNISHDTANLKILINTLVDRKNKKDRDCRLGFVNVDLDQFKHGQTIDQWFPIQPPTTSAKSPSSTIKKTKQKAKFSTPAEGSFGRSHGSSGGYITTDEGFGLVRLKITLTVERVLPLSEYRELLDVIVDPGLTVAEAISKVSISQLDEAAGTLVNIFALNNRVTHFVRTLTTIEIRKTDRAAIIFRGNTLGTKVIDMHMKMVGMDYLHDALVDVIRALVAEKDSLEIDPTRIGKGEDLKKNQKRLHHYCDMCFKLIQASVDDCPQEMKRMFGNIRDEVINKFKTGVEQYTAVSGFIFLRFFCPAILNPMLFGLVDEQPSPRTMRSLTLVAKVIQSLANLVPQFDKEPYMNVMLPFLDERQDAIRQVITDFARPLTNAVMDSEYYAGLDDRDLSRELAALHRLCTEKLPELKALSDKSHDHHLKSVFPILTRLEQRSQEYERLYTHAGGAKALPQRGSDIQFTN